MSRKVIENDVNSFISQLFFYLKYLFTLTEFEFEKKNCIFLVFWPVKLPCYKMAHPISLQRM